MGSDQRATWNAEVARSDETSDLTLSRLRLFTF